MKSGKAIERLQRIRQFYFDTIKDDTAVEAVDMAISALKKQNSKQYVPDPWDGIKPHAPDGFVAKYCEPYQEEKNEPK